MQTRQFAVQLLSGTQVLIGVWAFIFVIYLFMASSEINRDQDHGLKLQQPRSSVNSKETESKHFFRPVRSTASPVRSTASPVRLKGRDPGAECRTLPPNRNSCSKLPNFFLHRDYREYFHDAILNFWHIQKTGGSSMEMCLTTMYEKLNYPPPFSSMASCVDLTRVLDDITFVTNMTYRPIVHGHYSLGVCDFIRGQISDRKCSVFTIFREPYERAVSHYFFHREYADKHPEIRDSLELAINEWVKKFGSIVWNSFLFPEFTVTEEENGGKKCSHSFNDTLKAPWPQNEYVMNEIINNLETELSFIGLFEDQPTTYKMLQEVYNLPFYDVCMNIHEKEGSYEGLNATSRRELRKEAKEILMKDKELQELMKFDVKMYEKAKEIFYAQKREFEKMKKG